MTMFFFVFLHDIICIRQQTMLAQSVHATYLHQTANYVGSISACHISASDSKLCWLNQCMPHICIRQQTMLAQSVHATYLHQTANYVGSISACHISASDSKQCWLNQCMPHICMEDLLYCHSQMFINYYYSSCTHTHCIPKHLYTVHTK